MQSRQRAINKVTGRMISAHMSLQMALIARLSTRISTCRVTNEVLPFHCRSSWRHAVPAHKIHIRNTCKSSDDKVPRIMIQSTAAKALDWHRARSRTNRSRPSVATSRCTSWTKSRNVTDATTVLQGGLSEDGRT